MSVKPWLTSEGKFLLNEGGDPVMSEDCCCCVCETDGPIANFSYSQTSSSPCTFSLTDTTTGGCGDIVEWEWVIDGDVVSTSQNPTGIVPDGDGPWDVTLNVTDAQGCTDSVIGEVACTQSISCPSHTFQFPDTVEVDFGTLGTPTGACTTTPACSSAGGLQTLSFSSGGYIVITGEVVITYTASGPDGFDYEFSMAGPCANTGDWGARAVLSRPCTIGGTRATTWSDTALPWQTDWRGEFLTLPWLNHVPATPLCATFPGSVTVQL